MKIEKQIRNHIMKTVHTTVRVFRMNGELLDYHGDNRDDDAVVKDNDLRVTLLKQTKEEYPYIYQDFYPVYFITMRKEDHLYVIGPVNCDYTVNKTERNHTIGQYFSRKHHLQEVNRKISFCDIQTFAREGLLLFNVLHDKDMTLSQLLTYNYNTDLESVVKKELNQIYFRYQESEKLHNPYDQEVRELDSIREGNTENLIKAMDEEFEGEYATLSRDPLRSMKNLAIVSMALTCRAAIDGGMMPEEAFSLNDSYILRIDSAVNIMQIAAIGRKAKLEYAGLVHEKKMMRQNNRIIEEAKNLLFKQMHGKIIIRDIARELSITPEYLSSLFKKMEGIPISAYIFRKKIGLAENLLKYSNYSIEEISYYLGFCSQSHFGKHFKKINQMTPKKYREKFGVKEFFTD